MISDGARIARMGNIICAAYNKPEVTKNTGFMGFIAVFRFLVTRELA